MMEENLSHLTHPQLAARIRLGRLLFRHVCAEDAILTDYEFLDAVWARQLASRETYLVDPAE
jgi:hypothetical protein